MTYRLRMLLVLCLAGAISTVAYAHALKVFAYMEAGEIVGRAYFVSGSPLVEGRILIDSPNGDRTVLQTDELGEFSFKPSDHGRYRIVADTGEGHTAEWVVEVLPPAVDPPSDPSVDAQTLQEMVRSAVAREVGPLRLALDEYRNAVRLSDIIGGIGFIVGLAGALAWWRGRRQ